MSEMKNFKLNRRSFLASGTIAAASSAVGFGRAQQGGRKKRLVLVGTGSRGTGTWGRSLLEHYSNVVEIVGFCDINSKRVQLAPELVGAQAPTYHMDFDRMIQDTKPDGVLITTVDSTHSHYIVRSLELGVPPISEKPMCTDERQCQEILDAQRKSGLPVTVTFNARHGRGAKKVKELLMEGAIGDVISVDFQEFLNTSHGADYFRRWHRLKENSGTLLVHKACHHFDQANWWLDSEPVEVTAEGDLKFYGHNNPFRSTHCRVCPYTDQCDFYWDITRNERLMKLYVACESEDGYLRDRCVWSANTNIYDTMSVFVKYENGVHLTYTANTYLPYEGQAIAFNGTKGRLDYNSYFGGGHEVEELRLTPSFGESQLITDLGPRLEGGHGGADRSLKNLLFLEADAPDPLGLKADLRAGAMASLIGIAAYRSIERGGKKIRISDLVKF